MQKESKEISNEIQREILNFVDYVWEFYSPQFGIWKIEGLTVSMTLSAIETYLQSLDDEHLFWGGGDSVDRERVRDIILNQNSHLKFPN